jgi:hypothetical protein
MDRLTVLLSWRLDVGSGMEQSGIESILLIDLITTK